MHQLFDESLLADPTIARLLPQMHLVVDDLSHLSDGELRVCRSEWDRRQGRDRGGREGARQGAAQDDGKLKELTDE